MEIDMNDLYRKSKVVIVENDPALCRIMEISLYQAGLNVEAVSEYEDAIMILQHQKPIIFILDKDINEVDAGKLITDYRQYLNADEGSVIVSTANRLKDEWRQKYKPDKVVYKPFDIRYLIRLILTLLEEYQLNHA
jgi:DNA-binding NtrC family response regulator